MSVKAIFVLCSQALLAHVVFSACLYTGGDYSRALAGPSVSCGAQRSHGLAYGAGLGHGAGLSNGCSNGYAGAGLSSASINVAPTSGGALPVFFSSAIAPSGLAIESENVFEGNLNVIGELPFLGTSALEGAFPSGGAGAIQYSCGNGITAVSSDSGYSTGGYGLGSAGIGSGAIGYITGAEAYAPTSGLQITGREHACGCGEY